MGHIYKRRLVIPGFIISGPNRPGFPKHRINLNNPPGKKKIQAILSKVTGSNNNTAKRK